MVCGGAGFGGITFLVLLSSHRLADIFSYKGPNAQKIGAVPGVWARNLLANRIYGRSVVFLEPYIANSLATYPRAQNWISEKKGRAVA